MVRIGDMMRLVQTELQVAVDDIEASHEERGDDRPALRVTDVEVEVPFGVDEEADGGDDDGGQGGGGQGGQGGGGQGGQGGGPGGFGDIPGLGPGTNLPSHFGGSGGDDDGDGFHVRPGGTGGSFTVRLEPAGRQPPQSPESDDRESSDLPPLPQGLRWHDVAPGLDPDVREALANAWDLPDIDVDDDTGDGGDGDGGGEDSDGDSGGNGDGDDGPSHPVLLDEPDDDAGPASADATAVSGVGSTIATQLENAGITTVGGLAAAGAEVVADETELSESRARRVTRRAAVMALGASATTAKILVDLGHGPDVLAEASGEEIASRVRMALRRGGLSVRVPDDYEVDEAELRAVVERARSEQ